MRNYSIIALSAIFSCHYSLAASTTTQDWMPENSFTNGVEGPAVDKKGNLYAVNFAKQGSIGKISAKNQAEIFIELPNGSIGNGIRFDQNNQMYIADYVNHNILQYDLNKQQLSVFAHNPKMNQPNDIAIMDNDILFASDPNWSDNTGNIWRINNDGSTQLLESNMGTTNGIEVSPNNKWLYVNESVQRNIWRYQLDAQGNISNKSLFYQFANHGMDGMRCDKAGNLYVARYGAGEVVVISPQGQLIRSIKLNGQHPTNVAFGGKDGKQVFVTMQKRGTIETFKAEIAGRYF